MDRGYRMVREALAWDGEGDGEGDEGKGEGWAADKFVVEVLEWQRASMTEEEMARFRNIGKQMFELCYDSPPFPYQSGTHVSECPNSWTLIAYFPVTHRREMGRLLSQMIVLIEGDIDKYDQLLTQAQERYFPASL